MPSKWDEWAGIAAFIDGFLQQDPIEQKNQLDQLEGISTAAARITQIQGTQAQERRADALFPGVQTIQKQNIRSGELDIAGQERKEVEAQEIDDVMRSQFGMSLPVARALAEYFGTDFLSKTYQARLQQNIPAVTAKREGQKIGQEIQEGQAFEAARGPTVAGFRRAGEEQLGRAKSGYELELIRLRQERGLPDVLVNTERHLAALAPLARVVDIHQAYAAAQRDLGAFANTPAGKMEALRQAWETSGLAQSLGMSFSDYLVRDALRQSGDWTKPTELYANIRMAEGMKIELLKPDQSAQAIQALVARELKNNPEMLESLSGKSQDLAGILQGVNQFINVNKNLLLQQGIHYDQLANRERNFTEDDISRIIGAMATDPARRGQVIGFRSEGEKPVRIRRFLAGLLNEKEPDLWEDSLNINRSTLVQMYGQEDWSMMVDIVRYAMWDIGKIAGTAQRPTAISPGRPPQAAHLGETPEGVRIPEADKRATLPLVPIQRQENARDMLQQLMGTIDRPDIGALEEDLQRQFDAILQEANQ